MQPVRKPSLLRKHSASTTSTTSASISASPVHRLIDDPDIGLDESSDDDEDESQPYSHRLIKAKPTPSYNAQHHHHPGRPPVDEHKERMSPPTAVPSRPTVSVTRDESLASYDPSLLSTVTSLQQQLQQKDSELHQLSEALLLLQSSPTAATAASLPSSTSALVKDLMRQKRDLHLQLTRERQQHSQQLADLRASLLDEQQQLQPPTQCSDCDRLKDETSGLQGRLNGAKAAVREWQRKCERLESVLVKECGGVDELKRSDERAV